jgi:O-antigen/teichoic acid export membrane protein
MDAVGHHFVFVGGLEGSGSSLVAKMVASHPLASGLKVPGEADGDGQNLQDVYDTARSHGGSGRWAFSPEMHMDETSPLCTPENAERLWRCWQPYFDGSKPVLVERSSPNILKSRFLQGLFPQASFIMVVRHPIAVVEATPTRSNRNSLIEHWIRAQELMAEDLPYLERALVVLYEDIVENLQREYQRMTSFVGLPPHPASASLRAASNRKYYQSWERRTPLELHSAARAVRRHGLSVRRFGYQLTPPYVIPVTPGDSAEGPVPEGPATELTDGSPGELESLGSGRGATTGIEASTTGIEASTTGIETAPAPQAIAPESSVALPKWATVSFPGFPDFTIVDDGWVHEGSREFSGTAGREAATDLTSQPVQVIVGEPDRVEDPANGGPVSDDDRSNERAELRSTARRGTAFTGGFIATAVLQFLFFGLVTHTLTQGRAGALLEAIAIFSILSNVTELGADTGLLRFMPVFLRRRPEDLARVARVALIPSLVASTVAAVALFVFAPQLAHVFAHHSKDVGTTGDLRILAAVLPAATITTVAVAGVRAWTARTSVLINSVVIPVVRPVLFGMFVALGMTASLATLAWAAPIGVGAVIAVYALIARIGNEPRYRAARHEPSARGGIVSEFWTYSVPRTFGAIFQILITYLDVLFVGAFLSARQAGAYSISSRYIVYGTFALQAVSRAVAPQLARLLDDAKFRDSLNAVYRSSTWWTMSLSWPVLLVLAVFAPMFMSVFGPNYTIAVGSLTILALAMLANTGTGSCGVLLLMSGRTKLMLGLQAAGLAVNVGLNLWLIPHHGPFGGLVGAALSWTATILLLAVSQVVAIRRSFGILPFGRGYAVVAIAALGCFGALGLATRLAFGTGVATFVVFSIVSSGIYGIVLFRERRTLNLQAFESLYKRFAAKSRLSVARSAHGKR